MKTVLILCTGNTCRSVMAEGLLNLWGRGRFKAFSAGSFPTGQVNPMSLQTLARHGLPTDGYRSKSWNEFADQQIDIVITVCNAAAGESCPLFPGSPVKAHWGVPDPAHAEGTAEEVAAVFDRVYAQLERRVKALVDLPVETMSQSELAGALASIGKDQLQTTYKEIEMTKIQVYDPAICCSTGVCGVDIDQEKVNFAADVDWLKSQGGQIERFNLALQPMAFAENPAVKNFLGRSGAEALPLILVDGEVALAGRYPHRSELAKWASVSHPLSETNQSGGCCSGKRCC